MLGADERTLRGSLGRDTAKLRIKPSSVISIILNISVHRGLK